MIRQATRYDINLLVALAGELLPNKPLPPFQYVTTPGHFCILDDGGGYLFARIDVWNGERVTLVLSAAAKKCVSRGARKEAFEQLSIWSQEQGVGKLLAMTPTPEVFLKRWGFKMESFVVSKTLTSL